MRRFHLAPLFFFAFAACSSNRALVDGTPDAGGGPGGTVLGAGEYGPEGCDYVVAPPASRGFADFARDGASPFTADQAKPLRVRLGLGGKTALGEKGYADPSTSVVITWETAGQIAATKVRLGATKDALTEVHSGYSYTIPAPTIGVGAGDEVIVPAFTWVATANVALYCGATPVLVDVDPRTYNLDPAKLAAAVTPRTKAVIAVHLFGLCADIEAIRARDPAAAGRAQERIQAVRGN